LSPVIAGRSSQRARKTRGQGKIAMVNISATNAIAIGQTMMSSSNSRMATPLTLTRVKLTQLPAGVALANAIPVRELDGKGSWLAMC
jgi:hypothetical protein